MYTKKRIAIIACLILFTMFLAWGLTIAQLSRDGHCIPDYPLGEPGRGLMHSDTFYKLGYPGTHEYSGKACWGFMRVTKEEYSRHMYKE